ARQAWQQLAANFERVLTTPADLEARSAMLLGAHEAGVAIEQSMLGATHACANPLTAHHGTAHGAAIAIMLPHVGRWNADRVGDRYADRTRALGGHAEPATAGEHLAHHLEHLARAAGLATTLRQIGVPKENVRAL